MGATAPRRRRRSRSRHRRRRRRPPTPTPTADAKLRQPDRLLRRPAQPSGRRRSTGPDDGHSGQHVQVRLVHRERRQPAADPLPGRLRQSCRRPSGIEPQPARRRYDRVRDAQLRDTNATQCTIAAGGLGALCDLGQFDSGENATARFVVNAPSVAVATTTYASFKVAENVPDQGANRNTFFADANLDVGATNSNSNATWKTGGALSLSTAGQTLVKKDSMTTTVTGSGDGVGAISISEEDCAPTSAPARSRPYMSGTGHRRRRTLNGDWWSSVRSMGPSPRARRSTRGNPSRSDFGDPVTSTTFSTSIASSRMSRTAT